MTLRRPHTTSGRSREGSSTDRLRKTVGLQVVGIERSLAGLRSELERLRADNRTLAHESATLRGELARAEMTRLQQARALEGAVKELAALRARERERRALEDDGRRLADRCKDLELGVAREAHAARALRMEVDGLASELERLCAIITVLFTEEDPVGEEDEAAG